MEETSLEAEFESIYSESGQTCSAPTLARYGSGDRPVLPHPSGIETIGEETGFGTASKPFLILENGRAVTVSGKVDRIDRLTKQSLGVVDYKFKRY